MIYRDVAPSPSLRAVVDRLWYLEGPAGAIAADPIPPDGHVEIIVHAADPFVEHRADGTEIVQGRLLVAGQSTGPVRVAPRGQARMVGARLRPDGARVLFGLPQHEITNRIVDLSQIDRALARAIQDDVTGRPTSNAMLAALDGVLVRAMPAAIGPSPVSLAVDLVVARRGLARVSDLAAEAGVSPRQLERLFHDHVGIGPKLMLRITRFQHVLRAVQAGGARDAGWAHVAAAFGFYDQSHFIRDFKTFVGVAPTAWHISDASLAAAFSGRNSHPGGHEEREGTTAKSSMAASGALPETATVEDMEDVEE